MSQQNSIAKRKRLDARTFYAWHMAKAKKYQCPMSGENTPQRKDVMNDDCGANLEANRSRDGGCKSECFYSDCEQQRLDPKVKPRTGKGEVTLEQYVSVVPQASESPNVQLHENRGEMTDAGNLGAKEDCLQASESRNVQLHEKRGEMIEAGDLGAKEVPSASHEKIPSHLESKSEGTNKDDMENESNRRVDLPEELPNCKLSSPRFMEYLVPVGFSHLQLEKYCEILIKNSMLLFSAFKKEIILDDLQDILNTLRKCCDHPYLVDPSLQSFVNEGRPMIDYLSTGIEVSGKLLLLDKFLPEIREKQLKVLIVFQSNDSKPQLINLQHILDDFIQRRFDEDSYVHIYREFDRTEKQAALDLFNDKESGNFVMLIEKSSCQQSIKLYSVDFIILFNSDWSPINDMRCLKKMSIQSKFDHLKVFRLYSSNTVEEKIHILTREGVFRNISHNLSHMLLLWGTTNLFSKLEYFHNHCSSVPDLNSLSEQKLVVDVLHELSELVSSQDNNISYSLISKVPEAKEDYSSNISLRSEQDAPFRDDDIPHSAIWISLLEGRNPQWKLLPGPMKNTRRGKCLDSLPHYSEHGTEDHVKKSSSLKPRVGKVRSTVATRKARKRTGHPNSWGATVGSFSCGNDGRGIRNVDDIFNRRMKELNLKIRRELREFRRTEEEERTKLEEEHQLELHLISQIYGATEAKQEELKKLDNAYKERREIYKRQMDVNSKKLEDVHLALVRKEKQLKNTLSALLKEKLAGPTSALTKACLLDSELGLKPIDSVKNPIDPTVMVSDSTPLSEIQHSKEVEEVITSGSGQHGDRHDHTEILSVESDGVINGIPVPREGLSNTLDHDGSTNMEPSRETLRGVTHDAQPHRDLGVHANTLPMGSVSGPLDADGEIDTRLMASREALGGGIEPLCTSNEQSVENVTDFPSSRLTGSSRNVVQPQTCTTSGDSGLIEQPMVFANLCSNEIRQTAGPLAVSNCEAIGVNTFCQPDEIQMMLSDLDSCDDIDSLISQLLTSANYDQSHVSNIGSTTFFEQANSYFQEISSLSYNMPPSITGCDPLHYELRRMRKEEEAMKTHEAEITHLKSDCEKEIEERCKKYDLPLENELLHKERILANELLAETWKCFDQMREPFAVSQDALLSTVPELYTLQCDIPTRIISPTSVGPSQPVQVVHQLSELISIRPQCRSILQTTGNPQEGSRVSRPITSMPISNISTSFYAVPNQPHR